MILPADAPIPYPGNSRQDGAVVDAGAEPIRQFGFRPSIIVVDAEVANRRRPPRQFLFCHFAARRRLLAGLRLPLRPIRQLHAHQ
jgi:hypothetical protein